MKDERRRFRRVPISLEIGAKYSDGPLIKARSFDISGGGIRLFLPKKLPKGEVVKLKINLSVPPIIAYGKVVWTQDIEGIGIKSFQTGIQFTGMKPTDRAKICSQLASLLLRGERNTIPL